MDLAQEIKLKRSFLSSVNGDEFCTYEFYVGAICIRYRLMGSDRSQDLKFLKLYYQSFNKAPQQVSQTLEVTHYLPPVDYNKASNLIWNCRDPFIDSLISEKKTSIVTERDFVAEINLDSNKALMVSPHFSYESLDGLDNFLNLFIRPHLAKEGVLLVHASAVEYDGEAYIFFGPSGVGKSTLARLSWERGLKILGSDQVHLKLKDSVLWAEACPTSNPDFARDSAIWCTEPRKVKALCHLRQLGEFHFKPLDAWSLLPRWVPEIFSLSEACEQNSAVLNLSQTILETSSAILGEVSYPKDADFWSWFLEQINKNS